jgi:hypothetical protein
MIQIFQDQTVAYIILLVFLAVVLLLIALFIAYSRLLLKLEKLKKEFAKKEEDYVGELTKFRVSMEKQSTQMLGVATESAKKILSKAQLVTKDYESKSSEVMQNALKSVDARFEETLLSLETKAEEVMDTIPVSFKEEITEQVKEMRMFLIEEVSKTRETAEKSFTQVYAQVGIDLENYKKVRIADFEKRLAQIFKYMGRTILKKEITLDAHEALVTESLEIAKKQNVI